LTPLTDHLLPLAAAILFVIGHLAPVILIDRDLAGAIARAAEFAVHRPYATANGARLMKLHAGVSANRSVALKQALQGRP
jgi:hypothetical protein